MARSVLWKQGNSRCGFLIGEKSGSAMPRIAKMLFAASVLGAGVAWASEDLIVNENTEIDVARNIGNATINADLTVNNVKVLPDAGKTTYLPGEAGKTPQIVVTGSKGVYNEGAGNTHTMIVGGNGGMGCLVVRNGANARVQDLEVQSTAADPSTPGTNTVLRLESEGMAVIDKGYNNNPNAIARVVFAGGKMRGSRPFRATDKSRWLLEAEPGHDIRFVDLALQGTNLGENGDTVTLKTEGNVVIGDNGSANNAPTTQGKVYLLGPTNRIIWAHAGDIVLSNNVQLIVKSDNSLPRGPSHGGIRITKTLTDKQYFTTGRKVLPNFCFEGGYSSPCNWIDVQDGFMTNTSATAEAVLKLGTFDEDTSFKGHVFGKVGIEKHGAGKITLADAVLPHFKLLAGSAEVVAGKTNRLSKIESFIAGPLTSLSLNGGDLEFIGGSTNYLSALSVGAGHELRLAGNTEIGVDSLTTEGTIVKTGDGALDLRTAATAAPKIRVEGGIYRPCGIQTTNRWWRFTFKKAYRDSTVCTKGYDAPATETLSIGKVHLFDYGMEQVLSDLTPPLNLKMTEDMSYTGKESDLSGLSAGTICASPWFIYSSGSKDGVNSMSAGATWTGPASLTLSMASSGWVSCMVYTNKVVKLDDPDTWVTVAFRLKDDESTIRSYAIGGAPGNGGANAVSVTHWKVESSPTGKPGTWVTMDERAGETPNNYVKSADHLFTYYNNLHPYMLHSANLMQVASFDVSAVSATGSGQVDFSNVPESALTSSELTVDYAAGGGTYSRYAFGATGVLKIVNVPAGTRIKSSTTIPVQLGTVSGEENLKDWTVMVNGVARPDLQLMCENDVLSFRRHGLLMVIE